MIVFVHICPDMIVVQVFGIISISAQ